MTSLNIRTTGFTLIEVLVAVVILSIGLLGMAGIQIKGLRGTASSSERSQAAILANDIAERIHLNTNGIYVIGATNNEQYASVNTASINCAVVPTFCSDAPGQPLVNACDTAGKMAAFDIYDFACGLQGNAGVKTLLPAGNATITCNNMATNCPPGSQLTINVNWSELKPNGGDPINKTLTMVIIP